MVSWLRIYVVHQLRQTQPASTWGQSFAGRDAREVRDEPGLTSQPARNTSPASSIKTASTGNNHQAHRTNEKNWTEKKRKKVPCHLLSAQVPSPFIQKNQISIWFGSSSILQLPNAPNASPSAKPSNSSAVARRAASCTSQETAFEPSHVHMKPLYNQHLGKQCIYMLKLKLQEKNATPCQEKWTLPPEIDQTLLTNTCGTQQKNTKKHRVSSGSSAFLFKLLSC